MEDQLREQAWRDTLTDAESVAVSRLSSMPPAMATAYVYIEFKRELDEFRQIHEQVVEMTRPGKYVRDAFAGVLGGAAALGAATAYILGFTDKMR